MTVAQPTINFKEDFKNSVDLETHIEEKESVEEREFESFWELFYPRVHSLEQRTIEDFEQIYKEVYREIKNLSEEPSREKKGEPDFQKMKEMLGEIHTSLLKELDNLYGHLKTEGYPFRVCLGFIDALNLLECTLEIIEQQIKVKFYILRTQLERYRKAKQVSKIVLGNMFLIFRMYEIEKILEHNDNQLLDQYLDYLSGDIVQFTKHLIRYDFRPKITDQDDQLLKKYGDIIAYLVKNASINGG